MLTLIIGGARSGKSDLAQRLAIASGRPVVFVATAEARDDEMRARIGHHRESRPPGWTTVEAPLAVVESLAERAPSADCIVLDCVTLWVSNRLEAMLPPSEAITPEDSAAAVQRVRADAMALLDWNASFAGELVVVSNEVGMGVVPATALGRVFRDALGAANRAIAARADRVYHLVAGLALDVKAQGALTVEDFGQELG